MNSRRHEPRIRSYIFDILSQRSRNALKHCERGQETRLILALNFRGIDFPIVQEGTHSTFRVAEMKLRRDAAGNSRVFARRKTQRTIEWKASSASISGNRKQKSSSSAKLPACEVNGDWEEVRECEIGSACLFSNGSIRRFNR